MLSLLPLYIIFSFLLVFVTIQHPLYNKLFKDDSLLLNVASAELCIVLVITSIIGDILIRWIG